SQESLQLVDQYVTNQLKSMLSIANYVQKNSDMSTYFKELVTEPPGGGTDDIYERFLKDQRIREQLDTLATVRGVSYDSGLESDNCYVTVLLTNGDYFMTYSTDDFNPLDFAREPWFPELKKQRGLQSYWVASSPTVFRQVKKNHPYQISVAQTLSGQGTNIYGYVIVTFFEDRLSRVFYRNKQVGEVMILDDANRVISSKNPAMIGKLFPYPEVGASGLSSEIVTIAGKQYLITQQPLPMTGWHFVSMQLYKDAIANIQPIFNRVFLLQLVSFSAFLILLLLLLRRFTRPLIKLGRTAAMVQLGNLSVRSGVRGQDEIGRLGYSFDQMLEKVKEMIHEVSITHNRKRKAELAMLQAQIKPHFLFNVLNSIRMKVMLKGDQESAEMIQSLSKLLRMTVGSTDDLIPLHEEIALISDFTKLMNMRHREQVKLNVAVSPEALMIEVPRLCLQPIIENAMIHGLERGSGSITIAAKVNGGTLLLSISDNGAGMSPPQVEKLRQSVAAQAEPGEVQASYFSGIGLANVYERMKMTFGERFHMEIMSKPGQGTCIRMSIPFKEEAEHVQRDGS
ncbi:MAG TPA: histidine kinase, partial [Bacilli bacterium]